jgi:hypothetical protein
MTALDGGLEPRVGGPDGDPDGASDRPSSVALPDR